MRSAARPSDLAAHRTAADRAQAWPGASEVVSEIGLILAIHLAAAFAVGLTLRLLGIG